MRCVPPVTRDRLPHAARSMPGAGSAAMSECTLAPLAAADAPTVSAWERLVAENGLNPSLEPGWLGVAAASIGAARQVQLLVQRGAGDVRAIVPFFNSQRRMLGLPINALELGSNLMSYHAAMVAPTGAAESALNALIRRAGPWDVLHAANVPVDSETARAIEAVARALGTPLQVIQGDASPYLPIEGSWEQLIAGRNKKFRYKLRKRQEAISGDSRYRLEWLTSESDAAVLLRNMLAIEQRSWKVTAGMDISSREAEIDYHRRLLPYLARVGMLLGNVLYEGDRPIAYSLCCTCRGWVGHLKTSFDDEFADASPGAFVIDASIEKAFALGAREFDFLGHAAPHKLAWSERVRQHADYFLFAPRIKARLVGALKLLNMRWEMRRQTRTGARTEAQVSQPREA